MDIQPEADREFWRGALLAGGFTAIPRWALDSAPGTAEHEAKISNDLVPTLRRLADELEVPLSSVLLGVHAKVLGTLTGELQVTTGYVSQQGGQPLLCRLTTEPDSWRTLLLAAHRAESELLAHRDFPVDDLRRDLGITDPSFETVLDSTGLDPTGLDSTGLDPTGLDSTGLDSAGNDSDVSEHTVLWMGTSHDNGQLALRLRYRTDVLDADCAARIAGYHLTALELIAADPDAEHRRQSLLSAEELHLQLDGLAGPRLELPDRRVHELFEQRVEAHPDAIAAE
jgi:non-ribosomal peptide synthetase component F